MQRAARLATVALFLAVVYLPLLGSLAPLGSEGGVGQEKRELARFPAIEASAPSLSAFPEAFEAWFRDRFGLRSALIRLHSLVKFHLLRAGSRSVVIGREGWLYLWDSTDGALDHHRGFTRLSPEVLRAWSEHLEERARLFADQDIVYVFVVAPGKPTIYPEHLPEWLNQTVDATPLDQLLAHLKSRTRVPVLDLRPALAGARESGRVYYRTDTHWNDAGAYAAYRVLAAHLAPRVPRLRMLEEGDLVRSHDARFSGDLAAMLHLEGELTEETLSLAPGSARRAKRVPAEAAIPEQLLREFHRLDVWQADADGPTAVIVGDSFLGGVSPFLAASFGRTYHAHRSPLSADFIAWARPDVVVQEVVERYIGHRPEEHWIAPDDEETGSSLER
jgi:hypothetical protein